MFKYLNIANEKFKAKVFICITLLLLFKVLGVRYLSYETNI